MDAQVNLSWFSPVSVHLVILLTAKIHMNHDLKGDIIRITIKVFKFILMIR